jgi:hypothetical protein
MNAVASRQSPVAGKSESSVVIRQLSVKTSLSSRTLSQRGKFWPANIPETATNARNIQIDLRILIGASKSFCVVWTDIQKLTLTCR